MHSITALHVIHDHIQRGLNEKQPNKRTVMVALYLSRAFDTVFIGIFMKIIIEGTLPNNKKVAMKLSVREVYISVREANICDIQKY